MAATSSTALSVSSSSTLPPRSSPPLSTQCVSLPPLPTHSLSSQNHLPSKPIAYCSKIARNVVAMATGEAPAGELAITEVPQIVKSVQEAWDKVEDKFSVSTLAVAGAIALVGTSGMISAIDSLPIVPGVLEVVGIGYTGWFAYKNLVFKPQREALINKIKATYKDIIG